MNARRLRWGIAAAALTVVSAAAQPVEAGRRADRPAITIDGRSSYTIDEHDAVVLSAPGQIWFRNDREGRPVAVDARLVVDDGSLPEPGVCEPATAQISVSGDRRSSLELTGSGSVCGKWTDQTYIVTHLFTGRYDVVEARRRKLIGTDGFFEIGLTNDGQAFAFAVDT